MAATVALRLETAPLSSSEAFTSTKPQPRYQESLGAAQVRFKRALTVAYSMWFLFTGVDWIAGRYLDGPGFAYFFALRILVLAVVCPVLVRLYRPPPPSEELLTIFDLVAYTAPSVSIALMCARFHGLASPYAPGLCLVVLARTVTAQERWQRGLVMSGIPVAAFYAVLFGSALFLAPSRRAVSRRGGGNDAHAELCVHSRDVRLPGHRRSRRLVAAASDFRSAEPRALSPSPPDRDGWNGRRMGRVSPGLKRDVAMKILRPEAGAADARSSLRARGARDRRPPPPEHDPRLRLRHDRRRPLVLRDGAPRGGDAPGARRALGPLPPARAVHIVGQAARALGEAHERGIVHRDVKPREPVSHFARRRARLREGPRLWHRASSSKTRRLHDRDRGSCSGRRCTSLRRSRSGGRPTRARTSTPSGAVLYFLVSGAPPFEGLEASALLAAHIQMDPIPPSSTPRTRAAARSRGPHHARPSQGSRGQLQLRIATSRSPSPRVPWPGNGRSAHAADVAQEEQSSPAFHRGRRRGPRTEATARRAEQRRTPATQPRVESVVASRDAAVTTSRKSERSVMSAHDRRSLDAE